MKVQITIDIENDAFQPMPGRETARILRQVADKMEATGQTLAQPLNDSNGAKVGEVAILGDWE